MGFYLKLFGRCVKRYALKYLNTELEEYARESAKREQAKQQQKALEYFRQERST